MVKKCLLLDAGIMDYEECLLLQEKIAEARVKDKIEDTLILVEHPPTITLGRKSRGEEEILEGEKVKKEGIKIYKVDRGGKSTIHSPGQIIGYPIIKLSDKREVLGYINRLEELLREVTNVYGIKSDHIDGYRGLYIKDNGRMEKIGSIAISVKDNVSMHGFALNVNNDLKYFSYIVACGLENIEMTSISKKLSRNIGVPEIKEKIIGSFSKMFDYNLEKIDLAYINKDS
jgi:lipoate-protein ligase B